ncbi:bacteriocin fulvocin C-related protein [Amycolatopsis silviterrae]|uniref:Bacteriocin fulvocin C-related protein n=1 Tax=Amycolatopsis silviterrae TaxID=1656914 RepID=A0ABW5H3Z6_9PSEU
MSEWILAFDAGCGTCAGIADRISAEAGDRLTVAGLGEDRIGALRQQALGDHPPFAPTLLLVDGDRVRGWTGPALSLRLARVLGPARSIAVVRALNQADLTVHGDRRRFLKLVPAAALGAFVLTGGAAGTAMAGPGRRMTQAEARELVARLDPVPTGYREFAALPMAMRRVLSCDLPSNVTAGLWRAHFQQYRRANPGLSTAQNAVLDRAVAALPVLFTTGQLAAADVSAVTDPLWDEAVAAFGRAETVAVFSTLGPPEPAAGAYTMWCDCHKGHSGCTSCGDAVDCTKNYCNGCGILWKELCDGVCGG